MANLVSPPTEKIINTNPRSVCRIKHGLSRYKIFHAHRDMMRRCYDPSVYSYSSYGGRGITVCQRWNDILLFCEDIGHPPSKNHSLDRIDNDGNYEPGNCRWATTKAQHRNTSRNRILEFSGIKMPLCDWAERIGLTQGTLKLRLDRGWSVERALTEPRNAK
jgi:hypothetical protein